MCAPVQAISLPVGGSFSLPLVRCAGGSFLEGRSTPPGKPKTGLAELFVFTLLLLDVAVWLHAPVATPSFATTRSSGLDVPTTHIHATTSLSKAAMVGTSVVSGSIVGKERDTIGNTLIVLRCRFGCLDDWMVGMLRSAGQTQIAPSSCAVSGMRCFPRFLASLRFFLFFFFFFQPTNNDPSLSSLLSPNPQLE